MTISRRSLLGALGSGALAGLAGCTEVNGVIDSVDGVDDVRALANRPGPPEGEYPTAIGELIYEPGGPVDVDHRLVEVRNLVGLRETRDANRVASELLDQPEGKAEHAFDLDPGSVETFARYQPTQIFTGTFSREELLESFRSDDWVVEETHAGVDVVTHPEHPWYYAAGVGDGVLLTTNRHREVPPTELVKAHADALAGDATRYANRSTMQDLLSIVGGGDYVTAITSEPDLGNDPPRTLGVGRSLVVDAASVVVTGAFVFDESAPHPPEELVRAWLGEIPPWAETQTEVASEGRVGYFSVTVPVDDFVSESSVVRSVREGDPTVSMQRSVTGRYENNHGIEPPDATFTGETLDETSAVDCGPSGGEAIRVTYESGPAIPARRLVFLAEPDSHRFLGCGYELGDDVTPGDDVTVGLSESVGGARIFWRGPHGTRQSFPIEPEE